VNRPARVKGFTMVELVVVMILVGVLAALGIPRLLGDKNMEAAVFGDQVVSGLRRAQAIATSHRRVVCAGIAAQGVTMRLNACGNAGLALTGLADDEYATADSALAAVPMAPQAALLFFQPDGRVTTDSAGTMPVGSASIAITATVDGRANTVRTIRVEGTTGYVE
jgi:MSHA pilin protein MshC